MGMRCPLSSTRHDRCRANCVVDCKIGVGCGVLQRYHVIRVADEIRVDVMRSAGGIDYASAEKDLVALVMDGAPIPFASPRLLWRMKAVTHREKDAGDLVFLRAWFAGRGEEPPTLWFLFSDLPLHPAVRR